MFQSAGAKGSFRVNRVGRAHWKRIRSTPMIGPSRSCSARLSDDAAGLLFGSPLVAILPPSALLRALAFARANAVAQFARQRERVDHGHQLNRLSPAHSVNAPTLIATRNGSHALGTPPSVSLP